MVTFSQPALRAQENCVIILYFGERVCMREREREEEREEDTKRENEAERGDKDRKAEKRGPQFTQASHTPNRHIGTHLCFSYTFPFF